MHPFVIQGLLITFLAGCALGFLPFVGGVFIGACLFLAVAFTLLGVYAPRFVLARSVFVVAAVGVVLLSAGVLRSEMLIDAQAPRHDTFVGSEVTIHGTVVSEPLQSGTRSRITIEPKTVTTDETSEPMHNNVLVYVPSTSPLSYGDVVRVRGELSIPENYVTAERLKQGEVFDWAGYLETKGIPYEVSYADVHHEGVSDSWYVSLKRYLFAFKDSLVSTMKSTMPEPEATLAAGETVGEEGSFSGELEAALRATGIIHIVVLSGYNVTIIARSAQSVLGRILPRAALPVSIVGIIGFALMTGATPTVVRASIMAVLVLLARRYEGDYHILTALLLAAVVMTFYNPAYLVHDPSFQLSFVATLGLIYAAPSVEKWRSARMIPQKWGLREAFAATLSTQFFVLPLLVLIVGEVSIVSVPVNLLILPTVPAAMTMAFGVGFLGLVSGTLAHVAGAFGTLIFAYQVVVVEFFNALPFTAVTMPGWAVFGIYGLGLLMWGIWKWKLVRPPASG